MHLIKASLVAAAGLGLIVQAHKVLPNQLFSGYILAPRKANGDCKTPADWTEDLELLKSWKHKKGKPLSVRLYSTNDCEALPRIAQAAIDAKVKVFPTMWIKSPDTYKLEVATLTSVVREHGCDFLAGLSIGNGDIVRADFTSKQIASMIEDARTLLQSLNCAVPLTHVESFQQSMQYDYKEVIAAVDFLSVDFFAYKEGLALENSLGWLDAFFSKLETAASNKSIVIAATGWPTQGDVIDEATPSVNNLQQFWRFMTCDKWVSTLSVYWFGAFDNPLRNGPDDAKAESFYGLASAYGHRPLKINLQC